MRREKRRKERRKNDVATTVTDERRLVMQSMSLFLSVWQAVSAFVFLLLSSLIHSFKHSSVLQRANDWTNERSIEQSRPSANPQNLFQAVFIYQKERETERKKERRNEMRRDEMRWPCINWQKEKHHKLSFLIEDILEHNKFHGQKRRRWRHSVLSISSRTRAIDEHDEESLSVTVLLYLV